MPKSPSTAAATATAMNVSGKGQRSRRCNPRNRPMARAKMNPGCSPNSIYIALRADDARRGPGWLVGLAALFPHVDPGLAISIVRRNRHIGVGWGPRSRRVGASRLDVTLWPRRLLALGRPCGATGALRGLGDATGAAQLRARLARHRTHPLLVAADRLEGFRCRPVDRRNRACSRIERP